MPPSANTKLNLNTLLLALTILGLFWGGAKIVAPLDTLPEDVKSMRSEMEEGEETAHEIQLSLKGVEGTLSVHTDALQTLAKVAEEADELDDRVDAHDSEIRHVKERLNRLERN